MRLYCTILYVGLVSTGMLHMTHATVLHCTFTILIQCKNVVYDTCDFIAVYFTWVWLEQECRI